jgi:hypothetical protein
MCTLGWRRRRDRYILQVLSNPRFARKAGGVNFCTRREGCVAVSPGGRGHDHMQVAQKNAPRWYQAACCHTDSEKRDGTTIAKYIRGLTATGRVEGKTENRTGGAEARTGSGR